jgi:transposase
VDSISPETEQLILRMLYGTAMSYRKIAKEAKVSKAIVSEIARKMRDPTLVTKREKDKPHDMDRQLALAEENFCGKFGMDTLSKVDTPFKERCQPKRKDDPTLEELAEYTKMLREKKLRDLKESDSVPVPSPSRPMQDGAAITKDPRGGKTCP